jgi:ubiquitin carboxyl-terminal hydrolase 25/28
MIPPSSSDAKPADLLTFAYFAQARCNPAETVEYFTSYFTVCQIVMNMTDEPSHTLQAFIFEERERGRFTIENFQEMPPILGFGIQGTLGVEYDDEVPDKFVEDAWRDAILRSWREGGEGQRISSANDAFRRIAEMRGSEALWKKWEQAKDGGMTPERAYSTLEVPAEIDDGMLITIFSMRVSTSFVFSARKAVP